MSIVYESGASRTAEPRDARKLMKGSREVGQGDRGIRVQVEDIDRTATQVQAVTAADPELLRGESVRADGQRVPWAEAAFHASWCSQVLPFFLQYGNVADRAQRVTGDVGQAAHRVRPTAITGLRLGKASAHGEWMPAWPGLSTLPATSHPLKGNGILDVRIDTVDGPTVLGQP